MTYQIKDHVHRYGAWAASRAAAASPSNSFKVEFGVRLIEKSGLNKLIGRPNRIPGAKTIDRWHSGRRRAIIKAARAEGRQLSHGIAAKLINVYLKTVFTCGGYEHHPRVVNLHPPVDRLLFKGLKAAAKNEPLLSEYLDIWDYALWRGWTKFNAREYQMVINAMWNCLPTQPFWKIEEYWCGYQ